MARRIFLRCFYGRLEIVGPSSEEVRKQRVPCLTQIKAVT